MNKITMEDLGNIRCLSEVTCSPNGKAVAFVVSQADVQKNRYRSNIWQGPQADRR